MSDISNQQDLVKYMRGKYSNNYLGQSDEDVYNDAQRRLANQGKSIPDYNPSDFYTEPITPQKRKKSTKTHYSEEVNPSFVSNLFDLGAKIGLSGAGEMFINEGLDVPFTDEYDISADFFKKSYNNSSVGLLYQGLYGEKKYEYDIEDYDKINKHWAEEAGSFLVGMLSPVEVGIIAASGGLSAVGSGATRVALRTVAPSLFKKYASTAMLANVSKGLPAFFGNMATAGVMRGVGGGIGLGTFGAAHASLSSAAQQRTETGEINWETVMEDGAHGFADSFLLGVPMGLAGAGLGSIYGINKLAEKPLTSLSRNLFGMPGQLTTEIAAFSAMPNLYKELGVGAYKDYPAMFTDDWWEQAAMNAMIVTPMFAMGKVRESWSKKKELFKQADEAVKIQEETAETTARTMENVQANTGEFGLPNDLIQEIAKHRNNSAIIKSDRKRFKKDSEKLIEIIDRTEGDFNSATDSEIKFIRKNGGQVLLELEGILLELKNNPNQYSSVIGRIKRKAGKTEAVSTSELEIAQTRLNNHIEDLQTMFKQMNKNASGRTDKAPDVVEEKIVLDEALEPIIEPTITPTGWPKKIAMQRRRPIVLAGQTDIQTKTFTFKSNEAYQEHMAKEGWRPIEGTPTAGQATVDPAFALQIEKLRQSIKRVETAVGANKIKEISENVVGEKLLSQTDKYTKKINKEFKNIEDRELAAYLLWMHPNYRRTKRQRLVTATKDLLEFVRGKYDKSILELTKKQHRELVTDYIENVTGVPYWSEAGVFRKLNSGQQITLSRKIDTLRDNLFEVFGDQAAGLADVMGYNPLTAVRKIGMKGVRKITVVGGNKGLLAWEKYAKSKEIHTFKSIDERTSYTISKDEASLLSELARKLGARPEELVNLKVSDLKIDDFSIQLMQSKGKRGTVDKIRTERNQQDLVKRLIDFANETNKTQNSKLFSLDTPAKLSAFAKYLSTNSGKSIQIYDSVTNTLYNLGEAVPAGKSVGNLKGSPASTAGKGLTLGRVWRTIFDKDVTQKDISKIAKGRGQTKRAAEEYVAPEGQEKFQREAVGIPESTKELKEFLRQQAKLNPGLKINTLKDAEFAGRFQTGVIDITLGKANIKTWYHENAHRLKEMIDRTGNKELQDVWKQAEKLFKKEAKGRDMEEFIADELADWAVGRSVNKGVASKMRSWAGRLWTKIKQVFFGKSNLNKQDIRRLLGEKIYKGFAEGKTPASESMAMFQYASIKDRAQAVKRNFDSATASATKKLSRTDKNILIDYIADRAGIESPHEFKLGSEKMAEADIIAFDKILNIIPFKKLTKLADIGNRVKTIRNIERMELDVIPISSRKKVLEFFGVKDGDVFSASLRQLQNYQSYVKNFKYPGQEDRLSYLTERKSQQLEEFPPEFKNITGWKRKALLVGAPTHVVVDQLGLKELSNKLLTHTAVEARMIGKFNGFEEQAKKIMGGSWEGRIGKGARESMFLFDVDRYVERINTGNLSNKNKAFMNKAFQSDLAIVKDNQYIKNPKYKQVKEAINLQTKEGKVAKAWVDYTEFVVREIKEASKAAFKTDAEYREFLDSSTMKFITDNIYVSRIPTKKFMEVFGIGGAYKRKLLQDTADNIAKELAAEKAKELGQSVTPELVMEMQSEAMRMATSVVNDIFTFGKTKLSSRFLKKRYEKLPEYINIDGKKIKVYETKYDETVKPYGLGMSKMIANIEVFPEMTDLLTHHNISGFKGKMRTDDLLLKMLDNKEWGSWLEEQVERQLGVTATARGLADDVGRAMEKGATIFAKTALGFPTSGGKNFLLGQSMNIQTYKLRDYFRGLIQSMSGDFRKSVRLTGATELGLKHITSLKTQKFWDKVFKLGGMQPTENANRYIAIATSKYEQARLIRTISNPNQSARKIKKAKNRLKEFYFLNEEQIKILEKYGDSGLVGHKFSSSFERGKVARELKNIEQHMNTYAHINTQGASMNLFQPSWASGKLARPLTLFKRMAYAASANIIRNFKLAVKNGDVMKIAMMGLAPIATGVALTHVYHALLGKPLPDKNSTWYEWIKTHLIVGESLGIATEALRLLEGESAEMTVYPALHNWGWAMFDNIRAPIEGKKHVLGVDGAVDDFLKASSSSYRALMTNLYNRRSELYVGSRKYHKTLYEEFLKETFPEEYAGILKKQKWEYGYLSTRNPYYKDFKFAFYNGNIDEAAGQYVVSFFAVATDFFNAKKDADGNPRPSMTYDDALKDAEKEMKSQLTNLNPVPFSFTDDLSDDDEVKARRFAEWLVARDEKFGKNAVKEMLELEGKYKTKVLAIRELLPKYINDPKVAKSVSKSLRKAGFHSVADTYLKNLSK